MNTKPKVSIVSITYNQEKFIRQTLDGFVMQKADFAFEIIVADDASTDATPDIIKKYASQHPTLFKPILRQKNLGVLDNLYDALRTAKGQYIALCEGDDYWTDPEKIQRQADFLDQHPDYALCFHPVKVFFENGEEPETIYPDPHKKINFTVKELLKSNFIQTDSVMYRKQKYDHMPADIMPLDLYLHLYHARAGKIGFINRVMAAYRRHPAGIWWDSHKDKDEIWKKYGMAHLGLFVALNELYGEQSEYRDIINMAIENMFNKIIALDKTYGSDLLPQVVSKYPEAAAELVANQSQKIVSQAKAIIDLNHIIVELQDSAQAMQHQLSLHQQKLGQIQSSRVWKARNKVAKIRGHEAI